MYALLPQTALYHLDPFIFIGEQSRQMYPLAFNSTHEEFHSIPLSTFDYSPVKSVYTSKSDTLSKVIDSPKISMTTTWTILWSFRQATFIYKPTLFRNDFRRIKFQFTLRLMPTPHWFLIRNWMMSHHGPFRLLIYWFI